MTNSKSRPGRRETELGRGSCHREEESEEVLATRFPSWVRIRPVLPILYVIVFIIVLCQR